MTSNARQKWIEQGYHSITPYLILSDAASALAFYQQAFGGVELMRLQRPSGNIAHAEIQIGDAILMLADENPDYPFMRSPQTLGGSPVNLYLYVEDVDAVFQQALATGASVLMPVENQGEDRRGGLTDPFGLVWWIATRIEEWSRAEIQQRSTL